MDSRVKIGKDIYINCNKTTCGLCKGLSIPILDNNNKFVMYCNIFKEKMKIYTKKTTYGPIYISRVRRLKECVDKEKEYILLIGKEHEIVVSIKCSEKYCCDCNYIKNKRCAIFNNILSEDLNGLIRLDKCIDAEHLMGNERA